MNHAYSIKTDQLKGLKRKDTIAFLRIAQA